MSQSMFNAKELFEEISSQPLADIPRLVSAKIVDECKFKNVSFYNFSTNEILSKTSLHLPKALELIFGTRDFCLGDIVENALAPDPIDTHSRLSPTNIANMFATFNSFGEPSILLFLRNSSWVKECLSIYLYCAVNDSLTIITSTTNANEVHALLVDMYACFANLGLIYSSFWNLRSDRMGVLTTISSRNQIAAYYGNQIQHIAHYFLNFLGPLSKHLSNSIYPDNQLIFASSAYSWFFNKEFTEILPRVKGYERLRESIILVGSLSDASKLCKRYNTALFVVHGACASKAISSALYEFLSSVSSNNECKPDSDSIKLNLQLLKIGIGLRSGTRSVTNLVDLLIKLSEAIKFELGFSVHYVLDGMCLSNPNGEHETTNLLSIDGEHTLAENILEATASAGISCESIVGFRLIDQLSVLSSCDLVVTCSGSGSTKYLWALNKPTITLNYPYAHSHKKYVSQSDPYQHDGIGLLQGRAFREEPHTPEWYLEKSLCSAIDVEKLGHFRPNSVINVSASVDAIKDIIRSVISS
jgi:hypothetical protein